MRQKLQELRNKLSGQEVFIVGGGYSVANVNKDFLHDKIVVGINDAYQLLPNLTALYWCDNSWLSRHKHFLDSYPCDLRFHAMSHAAVHISKDIETTGGATVLHRTDEMGFDPDPNCVKGNNSGAHCLNLVINMAPKRIYLLGFDMRDDPLNRCKTHWHDNHELVVRQEIYKTRFIPAMNELNKEVRRLRIDVDIVNLSPTSALQCFRKDRLKGLYDAV